MRDEKYFDVSNLAELRFPFHLMLHESKSDSV